MNNEMNIMYSYFRLACPNHHTKSQSATFQVKSQQVSKSETAEAAKQTVTVSPSQQHGRQSEEIQQPPQGVTPQPQGVTPQPQGVTPQPQGVTPQPQGVTPQPQGVTPQQGTSQHQTQNVPPSPSVIINLLDLNFSDCILLYLLSKPLIGVLLLFLSDSFYASLLKLVVTRLYNSLNFWLLFQ